MKVKEYLVNRILELEKELKQVRNEKAGTTYGLQKLQEEVIKLNEKIDQYQMEREHIKEIITCNIGRDAFNHLELDLDIGNNDFKTLLDILDIKPEDYTYQEPSEPQCYKCAYHDTPMNEYPCNACDGKYSKFIKEDNNAETTD